MPYWYGAEMASEFEVSGGASDLATSQKVRITGKLGRKEISHTAVITRYKSLRPLEPPFEAAYGVRGLERWQLDPSTTGTRVTMRSEYQMSGRFGPAIDWLITRHAVARRNRSEERRV